MFKKWNETDGRADGRAKMDEDGDQIRWKKKIIFSFLFVCFVYPFGNNSKTNGADRNLGEKKLQKKTNKTNIMLFS